MAWSKPLFITCHLAAPLCLCHYLEKGVGAVWPGRPWGMGLACLTRYFGMAFLAAGGVLVLWRGVGPWRERLGRLACYGGLACLWLWRNYQVAGSWLGPRQPSATPCLRTWDWPPPGWPGCGYPRCWCRRGWSSWLWGW